MQNLKTIIAQIPKNIKITILVVASLLFAIIIILNLLPKEYDRITIENPELIKDVPGDKQNDFRLALLQLLQRDNLIDSTAKVTDVHIRENSFSSSTQTSEQGVATTYSFLIDIASLKQTYSVKIYEATYPLTDRSVIISCPNIHDSKYPNSSCSGNYDSDSTSLKNNLPYETKLPSGEKVIVKNLTYGSRGGPTVEIYLYSCNNPTPPLKETESLIINWVKNTVKDPLAINYDNYYQYHVRYGYCEDGF